MGLIFKCLLFLQNLYASMTDKDTADISSTVHLTHCETQFMQLFSFNIFDYKEQNIHNPFPNHKEIKSKEESKNASTISHQWHQWKSFHLFSDKDFFTSEHWPYLWSLLLCPIFVYFWVLCNLKKLLSFNKR